MGEEIEFRHEGYIKCDQCDNEISFRISGYEYPIGAFNYEDSEITGGQFEEEPHMGVIYSQRLVTDQIVLNIGYDIENLTDPKISRDYHGEVTIDHYGRKIPKQAHGSANIGRQTSSTILIMKAVMELFDRIVDKNLLVRRINVTACHLVGEDTVQENTCCEQLDLFTDYDALKKEEAEENAALERERHIQEAIITLREKYGKNAVLKGMNLEEGATTISRNKQIGGHKA